MDYQGGLEEMYRAVKMRFEINRTSPQQANSAYSMSAFNNLRTIMANSSGIAAESGIAAASQQQQQHQVANIKSSCESSAHQEHDADIEECCICLYALAPFQALFVAPCSHSYHFKCIRPLLESYPGFQCPICRTYSDLEASVAVEAEEVMEKYGLRPAGAKASQVVAANDDQVQQEEPALSAASSAQECVRSMSQMTTSMDEDQTSAAAQSPPDSHHDVQPTNTPYNPDIQGSSGDHPLAITSSNQTSQGKRKDQSEY